MRYLVILLAVFLVLDVFHQVRILVVQHQCQVAAIIQDHVRLPAVRAVDSLFDAPPVLLLGFTFPGEHRDAGCSNGRRRVILGREDIAGRPANIGAELAQCLDQDGGLDRHMQASGQPHTGQRLLRAIFFAQGHEARHFRFRNRDFLAAPFGQRNIGDFVILLLQGNGFTAHIRLLTVLGYSGCDSAAQGICLVSMFPT